MKEKKYSEFTAVMMKWLGYDMSCEIVEEMKWQAYKEFIRRLDGTFPASIPTMKKWFGIGGVSMPKREQLYEICFYLHATVEEAEVLFTQGIKEPSFQINDYHETIYLYGLENSLEFAVCQEMIEQYEEALQEDLVICHTHTTHELMRQFLRKKSLDSKQFLEWMLENQVFFKGYSKTTLDYLVRYRRLVVKYIREDAAICLNGLLNDTGYVTWKKRQFRREKEGDSIRRYIYSARDLEENLRKSILELVQIVYSEAEPNTLVIREVFSEQAANKLRQSLPEGMVLRMTEKRLSDLFNVSIQKERQIRATQALRVVKNGQSQQACPDWIRKLIREYSGKKCDVLTIQQARKWLSDFTREHRRRSLLIQRGDLLPLILYVVQNHYLDEIAYDMTAYNKDDALACFKKVANSTLAACNMALLDEKYMLDKILINCFHDTEMVPYAEALDVLWNC